MQGFEPPALPDQLFGQPVKQLGVRRPVALEAEVVWRANNASAKMVLPKAVGHNTGGQRVFPRNEPVGQHPSAPAGPGSLERRWNVRCPAPQNHWKSRF